MKTPPPGLVFRWMSFAEHGDRIVSLRRQVLMREQGFGEYVITSPYDEEALHIGAFEGDQLVLSATAYIFDNADALPAEYGLTQESGRTIQVSKYVMLASHRAQGWAELMGTALLQMLYETLRPERIFCILQGEHMGFQGIYKRLFGFTYHGTCRTPNGETVVMTIPAGEELKKAYLKHRKRTEVLSAKLGLTVPSLLRFLDTTNRMGLVPIDTFTRENLYTAPLSLRDELPRLSTQTRILFAEQKSRIQNVDFPPAPARFLDVGAGPGVYLAMLARGAKFKGYEFAGLDASKDMVAYARLNRPDINWIHSSIYDTKQPDRSYDVVHANFLMIHLVCPSLAIREVARILRPGGILYVVDVNDSTFEGPPVIADMVEAHHDLYEGNRNVMNVLPQLAADYDLTLEKSFSTRICNTARTPEPAFFPDEVHLDRIKLWGIFSFLGQREELAAHFKPAQEFYLSAGPEISICIQTHVYRKLT
jgi:ubiquinone/menaquinone biosynthesis C-methylase UbiE